jgi:hypothetical protein
VLSLLECDRVSQTYGKKVCALEFSYAFRPSIKALFDQMFIEQWNPKLRVHFPF